MAAIGAEGIQPLNINPNAFLGAAAAPQEAVASPKAVTALAEAFRQGQVSANDILSRYGEHAKAKEKAEIQLYKEAASPEGVEARKVKQAAEATKAKADVAAAPLEAQARDAKLKADIYDAILRGSGI